MLEDRIVTPAHWHTVAADRPDTAVTRGPSAGFAANARDVFAQMDSRGIQRAVLVGHSYGGGVALAAASLAPHRVQAVVLLASVGPGCVYAWDKLLAAPGTGPLCALAAFPLTPWIARARLARLTRRYGRPLTPASMSTGRSGATQAATAAGYGEPSWPSSELSCANWASWQPLSRWSTIISDLRTSGCPHA